MDLGALVCHDFARDLVVVTSFFWGDATAAAVEGRDGCEDVFVYDRANFWWEG